MHTDIHVLRAHNVHGRKRQKKSISLDHMRGFYVEEFCFRKMKIHIYCTPVFLEKTNFHRVSPPENDRTYNTSSVCASPHQIPCIARARVHKYTVYIQNKKKKLRTFTDSCHIRHTFTYIYAVYVLHKSWQTIIIYNGQIVLLPPRVANNAHVFSGA